jgi:hypothetical protein
MDPFAIAILSILGVLVGGIVLLGLFYPGSGTEQLDWPSPHEHAEAEAARDREDLAQMLEAANARRRARGEPELTIERLRREEQ